jgi:hypothetical protein
MGFLVGGVAQHPQTQWAPPLHRFLGVGRVKA